MKRLELHKLTGAGRDHLEDYRASDYGDYWKQGKHMSIVMEQEAGIVNKMMPPSNGWFADFGSGPGRFISTCLDEGRRLLLIDYAWGAVRQGRVQYSGQALWGLSADVANLPLRNSAVSGAIAVRLIQNSQDPLALMTEIYRVIEPGSFVVMSYFNRRSLLRAFRFGRRCFDEGHVFEHKARWGNMYGTHPRYFDKLVHLVGFQSVGRQAGSGFSYQITSNAKWVRVMAEQSPSFLRVLSWTCALMDGLLGPYHLSLWQFVLLHRPLSGNPVSENADAQMV